MRFETAEYLLPEMIASAIAARGVWGDCARGWLCLATSQPAALSWVWSRAIFTAMRLTQARRCARRRNWREGEPFVKMPMSGVNHATTCSFLHIQQTHPIMIAN